MTRELSIFDSPLFLGFEHFDRLLDRVSRSATDSYPPYNIEQLDDKHLRITVAVAGFTMDDLNVSIEQNQLVIRGKKEDADAPERTFIHRGIATRQFMRSFVLSDEIEVSGATMENGLLHIDLERIVPETTVKTIEIKSGEPKKNGRGKVLDVKKDDA